MIKANAGPGIERQVGRGEEDQTSDCVVPWGRRGEAAIWIERIPFGEKLKVFRDLKDVGEPGCQFMSDRAQVVQNLSVRDEDFNAVEVFDELPAHVDVQP